MLFSVKFVVQLILMHAVSMKRFKTLCALKIGLNIYIGRTTAVVIRVFRFR